MGVLVRVNGLGSREAEISQLTELQFKSTMEVVEKYLQLQVKERAGRDVRHRVEYVE